MLTRFRRQRRPWPPRRGPPHHGLRNSSTKRALVSYAQLWRTRFAFDASPDRSSAWPHCSKRSSAWRGDRCICDFTDRVGATPKQNRFRVAMRAHAPRKIAMRLHRPCTESMCISSCDTLRDSDRRQRLLQRRIIRAAHAAPKARFAPALRFESRSPSSPCPFPPPRDRHRGYDA